MTYRDARYDQRGLSKQKHRTRESESPSSDRGSVAYAGTFNDRNSNRVGKTYGVNSTTESEVN